MKKVHKIEEIDIDLFPESTSVSEYNIERSEYIAKYSKYVPSTREYHSGGLFSPGYYTGEYGRQVEDPVQGEARWNSLYPGGYNDWASQQLSLNANGEQRVIDKINELVRRFNAVERTK